ncbi:MULTISPECIES: hypothetical protein [Alteromonas]|mgnify:CR=1 FL=1|uniref:GRAM domain-containing protein n=1 Tax=Alteromonas pelagimontana TaxID=1858656 RepID=A0A6M4MB44_9ALTE|nr:MULTISPECIES: hypothetical protein [Alteromonas]MCG7650709.1 hypothetical protein [Alteromonas sp. MmMcT2-5]QJR80424.1 hypothetical protein CA267_006380 [Alteromonas pelagimontana]|tara:strand:+ start:80 stop:379 length:300 start_codon:yes stop_codon:yes gene_type:complete
MQDATLKSITATVQNGVAKADGKFWITETDIHFAPYNKDYGLGPLKIERSSISKVEKCLGKGAGILPITSDAIEVSLLDGSTFQFIVSNPNELVVLLSK